MNNVMCVKYGDLYDYKYVNNLYGMVERNLTKPFRFICLTDDPIGIREEVNTKPLIDKNLVGWWSKIEFFKSPLYDIEGNVLTMDLDMIIVNNIDEMFNYAPDKFCMKEDYGIKKNTNYGNSSCVMRLIAGKHGHVYDNLNINDIDYAKHNSERGFKKHKYWGDQIWITEQMLNNTVIWPQEWIKKYVRDCHRDPYTKIPIGERNDAHKINLNKQEFFIPEECKIIAFSGTTYKNENQQHKIKRWWKS